jgi:hypothetical protein
LIQEGGVVVVVTGEDESDVTLEKGAGDGIETDIGGGAQISGRGVVNSGRVNGGTSTRPKRTAAAEVGGEEVVDSTQTKRAEACSCSPVAGTQEAATLRGMAEVDR